MGKRTEAVNLFHKHTGQGQYKDICWWVYELEKPVGGYTHVYCMPYTITEEMMTVAATGNTTRDATTPDIDKRGTGNIHPSGNDIAAAAEDIKIRQLVLCVWHEDIRQFGPALKEGMVCDGAVYHHYNADVPAGNYYPMITKPDWLTTDEQEKQDILKKVARLCEKCGLLVEESINLKVEKIDTIDLSRFRDENDKRIHKPKDDKPLSRQEELDLYRKEKEKLEEFLVDKPRPCVHFILDPDILSAHPDTLDVIRGIHGYHTQRSTHIDIIASQSFLSVVDTIDTDIKASISRGRLRYEPATDNLGLDATIDPYQLVSIAKRYEFDGLGAYIITERVGVKEAAKQYHTNVLSYDALVRWLAPIKAYRQNLAAYRSGDPIYEGNIDWGMLLPEHRYRLLDYAGYKAIDISPEDHYRDSEYWWLYHEEDATVMAPAPATTSDPEEQSAPEQDFPCSIPPGFSKSKIEGNDEEHFKLVSELGDDSVLQQVLDVILCAGHLDPTEQTVQLFLYKLSGRKRPDGESLPKIEWAGDPKALYYIIRSATTSIRNKYKRMEQLFLVAHSKNPAQDADNADKTFRDELHKISRAFTLKEHR